MERTKINISGPSKSSSDSAEGGPFSATLKNIKSLIDGLICVKCGNLPREYIFNLGCCKHSHCENCIESSKGRPCTCCGKCPFYPKDAKKDYFSSSLLDKMREVSNMIENCNTNSGDAGLLSDFSAENIQNVERIPEDVDIEMGNEICPEKDNHPPSNHPSSSISIKETEVNSCSLPTKSISDNAVDSGGSSCRDVALRPEDEVLQSTPKQSSESPEILEETPLNKSRLFNKLSFRSGQREKRVRRLALSECESESEPNSPVRKKIATEVKEKTPVKTDKADKPEQTYNSKEELPSFRIGQHEKSGRLTPLSFESESEPDSPVRKKIATEVKEKTPMKTDEADKPEQTYNSEEDLFGSYDPESKAGAVPVLTPYVPEIIIDDVPVLTPYDPVIQSNAFTNVGNKPAKFFKTKHSKKQNDQQVAKSSEKTERKSGENNPPILTPHVVERSSPATVCYEPAIYDADIVIGCAAAWKRKYGSTGRERRSSNSSATSSVSSALNNSNCGKDLVKRNAKGETSLHTACRNGELGVIRNLIECGADVNAVDNAGWTPLHDTISGNGKPKDKVAIVKLLYEKGCNLNAVGGFQDDTPLHEAAEDGLEEVVDTLLSCGASPNIRNSSGKLARDVAKGPTSIQKIFERHSGGTSSSSLLEEDPVALRISLKKALVYFNFPVSKKTFEKTTKTLQLRVTEKLNSKVTHIIYEIASENEDNRLVPLGWEYFYGLSHGMWQLSFQWIMTSIRQSKCLAPTNFEVVGCSLANTTDPLLLGCSDLMELRGIPELSRRNCEQGFPGLFCGLVFYLYKNCNFGKYTKKDLSALIIGGGGRITNREPNPNTIDPLEEPFRHHAQDSNHKFTLTSHIILYDSKSPPPQKKMHNMEHVKTLKTEWLMHSLGRFCLLNPENYL